MNPMSTTHSAVRLAGLHREFADTAPLSAQEAMQARFALRVTAALTQRNQALDVDVTERLRFAREAAMAKAKPRTARVEGSGGSVVTGWLGGRWQTFAPVLPALALIAGLLLIQRWQDNAQISVAAEVDAALLSDDVPPAAYSDAGFIEFLKSPGE